MNIVGQPRQVPTRRTSAPSKAQPATALNSTIRRELTRYALRVCLVSWRDRESVSQSQSFTPFLSQALCSTSALLASSGEIAIPPDCMPEHLGLALSQAVVPHADNRTTSRERGLVQEIYRSRSFISTQWLHVVSSAKTTYQLFEVRPAQPTS